MSATPFVNGRAWSGRGPWCPLLLAGGMNERTTAFDAQHVLKLPREYRVFVNTDASHNVTAYTSGGSRVRRMKTCN
jgi:hypothetical protein